MFDVLVYLFENYAGPNEAPKDPDELRARLADAGFEGDEIDEALSWLDTLRNGEAHVGAISAHLSSLGLKSEVIGHDPRLP